MRQVSVREVRAKLSVEWLGDEPVELTSHGFVVATIYPMILNDLPEPNTDPRVPPRTGVAAPTPVAPVKESVDPRVPSNTGVAAPVSTNAISDGSGSPRRGVMGLSKSSQASGKSRA